MWIFNFPRTIVEKTVFSSLNGLGNPVKIHLTIYVRVCVYVLYSSICPYVYLYASTTLFWLVWFCSNFEMRKCENVSFVLLFQDCFWGVPWCLGVRIWHFHLQCSRFNPWSGNCVYLVIQSCLTLCNPVDCSPQGSSVHGDSPGQNIGVGCHALLQRIFPTQGLNPGLPNCRQILYSLSHQGTEILRTTW